MKDRHQIKWSFQPDLIVFQIITDLFCRHPAFKQRGKKVFLKKRQTFHIVFLQLINVSLFINLFIQRFPDPAEKLLKLPCIDRL